MSGPKSSRYILTIEQSRILAKQREIERRKAVASESIKQKNKRILQFGSMFSADGKIAEELTDRFGDDGGFSSKRSELDALITAASSVSSKTNYDDVASLENAAHKISDCLSEAERLIKDISTIAANNEIRIRGELNSAIDQAFSSCSFEAETKNSEKENKTKENAQYQLVRMKNEANLSDDMRAEIQTAIDKMDSIKDGTFFKNYVALIVTPLLKKCKASLDEYEECHAEFDQLYSEYTAVCQLYSYVAQEYVCSREAIEVLKSEIKRIKENAAEDDEQAYISDCLDEVMEDMGYAVLGSREVVKKNGKHFKNELFTYGEGTAVNVTYSSDGKIAMELGGIDETDRLPDADETSVLCEAMEAFCDDFKEIEKRLLAKGVILADRISMLPPSSEYAQIINTTDYQMTKRADKLQAKRQQRSTRNYKAAGEE